MADMIKVFFFTRQSKINKQGLIPIYMRVTLNGGRYETTTSKNVDPKLWSSSSMVAIVKNKESRELNDFLQALRSKAIDIQTKLLNPGISITIEEFSKQWHGKKEKPKMLLAASQKVFPNLKPLSPDA